MSKLELLSVVAPLRDSPKYGLVRGQMGTVVELLSATVAEVEFSDDDGNTYAMVTMPAKDLIRLHHQAV